MNLVGHLYPSCQWSCIIIKSIIYISSLNWHKKWNTHVCKFHGAMNLFSKKSQTTSNHGVHQSSMQSFATVPLNLSQIMPYKYLYTFSMITSLRLACPPRFILFQITEDPASHYPVDFSLTGSLTWVGSCVYVYIGISLNHNILHTILGIAAGQHDKGVQHSSEILRSLWTKHFVHVAKFLSQRVPYNE